MLRQNPKHRRKKYKLLRQSATVNLSDALGRKVALHARQAASDQKGQTVALSYPSWVSNFASSTLKPHDNQWRASRSKKKCGPPSNDATRSSAGHARASPSKRSARLARTAATTRAARLLYWAYYVPDSGPLPEPLEPLVAGVAGTEWRAALARVPGAAVATVVPARAASRRCHSRCRLQPRRSSWRSWWSVVVVDELVVVVDVVLWVVLCVVVDELVVVGGTVTVGCGVPAAADRQRADRQRRAASVTSLASRLAVEGRLAQPAVGAVADVDADQLIAAAADRQVLRGPQKRGIRRRERQRSGDRAASPRRSPGRRRRCRARSARVPRAPRPVPAACRPGRTFMGADTIKVERGAGSAIAGAGDLACRRSRS